MEFNVAEMIKDIKAEMAANLAANPAERFFRSPEGRLIVVGDTNPAIVANLAMAAVVDPTLPIIQQAFSAVGLPVQTGAIFVSNAFWDNAPANYRDAIIGHEEGHLAMGHLDAKDTDTISVGSVTVINVDQFEIEADEHGARQHGAETMIDALQFVLGMIAKNKAKEISDAKGFGPIRRKAIEIASFMVMWAIPQFQLRFKALRKLKKAGL